MPVGYHPFRDNEAFRFSHENRPEFTLGRLSHSTSVTPLKNEAMPNIAICFDTQNGHSKTIAKRMARQLVDLGHDLVLFNIRKGESPSIAAIDGIAVIGPIYKGQHSRFLRRFVKDHFDTLQSLPSAFLSVSLSAAGDREQQRDAHRVMDQFLEAVRWQPDLRFIVAGDLPYTKYRWLTRLLMKWVVRRANGDTDTSRDYEYTDWAHLKNDTKSFAEFVFNCKKGRPQLNLQKSSVTEI